MSDQDVIRRGDLKAAIAKIHRRKLIHDPGYQSTLCVREDGKWLGASDVEAAIAALPAVQPAVKVGVKALTWVDRQGDGLVFDTVEQAMPGRSYTVLKTQDCWNFWADEFDTLEAAKAAAQADYEARILAALEVQPAPAPVVAGHLGVEVVRAHKISDLVRAHKIDPLQGYVTMEDAFTALSAVQPAPAPVAPDVAREFSQPYELTHADGDWWTLKAHGFVVATYSLKAWGSADKIIEAAWQRAYVQPAPVAPEVAALVEAAKAGWNAARKTVYGLCESTEERADMDMKTGKATEHQRGFFSGERMAAKSIRKAMGSFEAENDDNFNTALAALEARHD